MNQSELYLMVTIAGRARMADFMKLFRDKGLETHLVSLGHGTASQRYMRLLALNETEKMISMSVVTGRKWLEVKRAMKVRLRIDMAGVGIAYVIPLASIAGKRELMFLTDGQGYEKGEETALKGTEQELLFVVGNQGYSEMIMDAARAAGASGGTVLHARGVGQDKAETFMGMTLASERDVILIVTLSEKKAELMRALTREAGPDTKAGAVIFSVPVTDTAGLNLRPVSEELEDAPEQAEKPGEGEIPATA